MINAAIVGLGWWGKTLVEALADGSDVMRFIAVATRTMSPDVEAFAARHALRVASSYEEVLGDPTIDAVVLATPPSTHVSQVIAAAAAGKHVFCEKPFTYSRKDAEAAVEAVRDAKRALGVGYNRRFHPEMAKLRERIRSGELGVIEHVECSMSIPNRLFVEPTGWRAMKTEMPCGGLAPLGVHAVDAMIDLCGEIDHVYCQSFAGVLRGETDDTTSMLFRMKGGMSGYLGTITTTAPIHCMSLKNSLLTTTGLSGVFGSAFLAVTPAVAVDFVAPAVDGVNWKVDGLGGSIANGGFGAGRGAVTVPLGGQFGFQLDGIAGGFDDRFFGGAAGHLFWRDPARGLIGLYGSYTSWDKIRRGARKPLRRRGRGVLGSLDASRHRGR